MRALLVFCLVAVAPAWAWDGNRAWEEPTTGPSSGGGGIWGTGGWGDKRIGCTACHVAAAGRVDLSLTFAPPLAQLGGLTEYKPGQRYQVTATLTGEWKGRPFLTCGQYLSHTNGFGAAFELGDGTRAGRLESDDGQDSANCPATIAQTSTNTTITYGRCHGVLSNAAEDLTQWTFFWTAPPAGSGTTTVFYGVVDGDCDMKSTGDDAKMGELVLGEGIAARDRLPGWPALGLLALGLALAATAALKR